MAVQGAAGIEGKLRAGAAGTDDISRGHPRGRNERVNCGEQQGDVDEEEQNSGEEEDEGQEIDGCHGGGCGSFAITIARTMAVVMTVMTITMAMTMARGR